MLGHGRVEVFEGAECAQPFLLVESDLVGLHRDRHTGRYTHRDNDRLVDPDDDRLVVLTGNQMFGMDERGRMIAADPLRVASDALRARATLGDLSSGWRQVLIALGREILATPELGPFISTGPDRSGDLGPAFGGELLGTVGRLLDLDGAVGVVRRALIDVRHGKRNPDDKRSLVELAQFLVVRIGELDTGGFHPQRDAGADEQVGEAPTPPVGKRQDPDFTAFGEVPGSGDGSTSAAVVEGDGAPCAVLEGRHETSPSVGRSPVAAGSVGGAPGASTPGAVDPTVGEPADSGGGPSASLASVGGPVGGGEATAPSPTVAPGVIPDDASTAWVCPCGAVGYLLHGASWADRMVYEDRREAHERTCPDRYDPTTGAVIA